MAQPYRPARRAQRDRSPGADGAAAALLSSRFCQIALNSENAARRHTSPTPEIAPRTKGFNTKGDTPGDRSTKKLRSQKTVQGTTSRRRPASSR